MTNITLHTSEAKSLLSDKTNKKVDSSLLNHLILMDRVVDLLIAKAKSNSHWPDLYHNARNLLGALPIATSDYNLAKCRLTNAENYALVREYGAATYELRQLRTQLTAI